MFKTTTNRVFYCRGNSFGDQYASNNCSEYGTKWRQKLKLTEYGDYEFAGTPILLDANWTIDENKIAYTDGFCELFCV